MLKNLPFPEDLDGKRWMQNLFCWKTLEGLPSVEVAELSQTLRVLYLNPYLSVVL